MKAYMEKVWEIMTGENTRKRIPLYDEANPKGVTFDHIRQVSGRVYSYLKSRGIGREDFVMIQLPRGVNPVIAMVGVWRAGAAFVIAEEIMAPERVDYIYKDCGCKLVINSEAWEEISRCEYLDGYEQTDPHDAAYAVYTSGTTGNPKGVLHEYGNLLLGVQSTNYQGKPMIAPGDRGILVVPLNFIASVMILSGVLYGGDNEAHILSFATVKNPIALIKYLLSRRITVFMISPTFAKKLAGKTGPFLKKIIVGSEPANNFHIKGLTNYNMYSQSESGFVSSMFVIDKEYDVCPIGKPQFDLKYKIVDEEGNPVPDGQVGEFAFENPFVRGYINLPEETAKFFRNGYFHSGDLVQKLADGNLVIRGRKSDMIKINGNRIEPAEIESAIRSALNIEWCAVRGFSEEDPQFICAYYKDNITFDAADLRNRLMKRLPYYMIPAHFVKVDEIPVKPNGKMDRSALPKPELKDIVRTYEAPTNELEATLCRAMQTVLGLDRVGIHDDFYQMGGDSLASMELLVESALPGLDAGCIFRGRTPAEIARIYAEQVNDRDPNGDDALNEAAKLEEHKLTPMQRHMLDYQNDTPNSTMYNIFAMLRFEKSGVELDRMAKALEVAIKEHPALRTILKPSENGEIVQKYDPEMPVHVAVETLSQQEFDRVKDTLVVPYEMLNSPLFRCRLFETEDAAYLFLDVHHILFDGTSFKVFMDSLVSTYIGAPLVNDYYYLTLKRREQMEKTAFYQESGKYFADRYDGINWTVRPKVDRKGGENRLGKLAAVENILPSHISAVEKKYMVSRNEFYIAATLIAMAINTGKSDVKATWVYNGRDDLAAASSVGSLFRELPVALRLRGETNLRDIFAAVHEQVQNGIKHSCYPYMENTTKTMENDSVCVVYQKDLYAGHFGGLNVEQVPVKQNNAAAQTMLDIHIFDHSENLEYVFDYAASHYDQQTMGQFQDLFKRVVAAIVHNATSEGYLFKNLTSDVNDKTTLAQKIKKLFGKK